MPDTSREAEHPFSQVPVEVIVTVGRAKPKIADLLQLQKNAVLVLDHRVDDPVELYVGEKLIARGELVEQDGPNEGQLAVRLTEIAGLNESIIP